MAKYNYRRSTGEPNFTDLIRIRIEDMEEDTEFSIADFKDIPTNISSALKKLEAMEEIVLLRREKIEGERYSRNFYKVASLRLQDNEGEEKKRKSILQGWEKVYPEFFTIPKFIEKGIIKREIEL